MGQGELRREGGGRGMVLAIDRSEAGDVVLVGERGMCGEMGRC